MGIYFLDYKLGGGGGGGGGSTLSTSCFGEKIVQKVWVMDIRCQRKSCLQ